MCSNCGYKAIQNSPYGGYFPGCCEIQEGYYCIWDRNMMALQCEEWAELCDLRNVIRQVSHIAFNVVADRQRARTALNNLKREAPFTMCKRFPVSKIFVNLSCSVYANILQNILNSLDYKDRETEKEMKFGRNGKQDDNDQTARHEYSLDDSKTQFRNNMKILDNELCKLNEVYDRVEFERKYTLTWCIGKCPDLDNPSKNPPGKPSDPNPPKPNPPPTVPPSTRTYGQLLDALEKKGLRPKDFLTPIESQMNWKFECEFETQTIANIDRNREFPIDANYIYVFADAEYQDCANQDVVSGFIYNVSGKDLTGPTNLKATFPFDEEGFDSDSTDKSSRWPNSRLRKGNKKSVMEKVVDNEGVKSFVTNNGIVQIDINALALELSKVLASREVKGEVDTRVSDSFEEL